MSDIKLFRVADRKVVELEGSAVALEKSLQTLMEENLDVLLGVRFLASEYSTGRKHAGRIDTLGLDENGSPVIIEYKRTMTENVINQGLFYLDWLMDHQAELKLLVMEKLGGTAGESIDWQSPRLICIAGDFTRYDTYAVEQMNHDVQLIRYKRFGDDLILLELVNSVSREKDQQSHAIAGSTGAYKTISQTLGALNAELAERYADLRSFLLALGDDVQEKVTKYYVAFKRIKNFACVEVHPQKGCLSLFLKVDPESIVLEPGFTRDVTATGHFGTGGLEVTLRSAADLERAKPLLMKSYEAS